MTEGYASPVWNLLPIKCTEYDFVTKYMINISMTRSKIAITWLAKWLQIEFWLNFYPQNWWLLMIENMTYTKKFH